MNTFNVKEAAEQSLLLLEQSGASAKTVKGYRNTGFGTIIRYFMQQGSFDVTFEMLDTFVLEQGYNLTAGNLHRGNGGLFGVAVNCSNNIPKPVRLKCLVSDRGIQYCKGQAKA